MQLSEPRHGEVGSPSQLGSLNALCLACSGSQVVLLDGHPGIKDLASPEAAQARSPRPAIGRGDAAPGLPGLLVRP